MTQGMNYPLCIDCEWVNFSFTAPERATCGAPQNFLEHRVSLVTGARLPLYPHCAACRNSSSACSKEGKWFTPTQSPTIFGASLYEMHDDPGFALRSDYIRSRRPKWEKPNGPEKQVPSLGDF